MEYIANWGYVEIGPWMRVNKDYEVMIAKKLITILFIFGVIYSLIGWIWKI